MQREDISNLLNYISDPSFFHLFRVGIVIPARIESLAFFLVFLCFILFPSDSSFSNDQWINYTNTSTISMLALEGNYLWQGSEGGAVRRGLNNPLSDTFYYNHARGLGGTGVGFVLIDHLGRKWFASGGLTVWDGVTSISYDTSNSGLISNYITCLAEDKLGRMWIGTVYGLSVFDGSSWTNYDTSIFGDGVTSLAVDDSGRAWIGTSVRGVWQFDGANWKVYNKSNSGLYSNWVSKIVIEHPNKVWFACSGGGAPYIDGVSVFDGANWISYDTTNSGLANIAISSIAIDSLGRKWFGGCCGGLSMFDGVNWVTYDTLNSELPTNDVGSTVVVDSSGNLWMPNRTIERDPKYSLTKFDGTNWFVYDISRNQLPSNWINNLVIDHLNNKWIGTDKGLCEFDGSSWTVYAKKNSGMPGDGVGALAFDTNGNLWMLCGGGVTEFDGTNWTNYDTSNSGLTDSSVIMCMAIDKNNVKWFGTMFEGILRFDDATWTFYNTSNSPLPYNWVQSLAVDSSNSLWVGTEGVFYQGLSGWVLKFDGANWNVYNPSNSGLPFNVGIWSLAVDAVGRVWISTYLSGLAMFDGTDWVSYSTSNSGIGSNNVVDIGIDHSGSIWCAIEDPWGLSNFDGSNWTVYNTKNSGLSSDDVSAIAVDYSGNKWFGTEGGGVSFLGKPTEVVEEPPGSLPKEFALAQNYPNPFNPFTTIPFQVNRCQWPEVSPVRTTLKIYNIRGQLVRILVDEEKFPGNYKVIWDGKDNSGKEVASGIYFYQLKTPDFTSSKKMVLIK